MKTDTIAAIATGMTNSGIGIIRISGPDSVFIANKSIISQNGLNKCVLTSGYLLSTDGTFSSILNEAGLVFSKDNTQYCSLTTYNYEKYILLIEFTKNKNNYRIDIFEEEK